MYNNKKQLKLATTFDPGWQNNQNYSIYLKHESSQKLQSDQEKIEEPQNNEGIFCYNNSNQNPQKKRLILTGKSFKPDESIEQKLQQNMAQKEIETNYYLNEEIQNVVYCERKQYYSKDNLKQLVQEFSVLFNDNIINYQKNTQIRKLEALGLTVNLYSIQEHFSQPDWIQIKKRKHCRIKDIQQRRFYQNNLNDEDRRVPYKNEKNEFFANSARVKEISGVKVPNIEIVRVDIPILQQPSKCIISEDAKGMFTKSERTTLPSTLLQQSSFKNEVYDELLGEINNLESRRLEKSFKVVLELIFQDGFENRRLYVDWVAEIILSKCFKNPKLYIIFYEKLYNDTRLQQNLSDNQSNGSLLQNQLLLQIKNIFLQNPDHQYILIQNYLERIQSKIIQLFEAIYFISSLVVLKLLKFEAIFYIFQGMITEFLANYHTNQYNDEKPLEIIFELVEQLICADFLNTTKKMDLSLLEEFFDGTRKDRSSMNIIFEKFKAHISLELILATLDLLEKKYKISQKLSLMLMNITKNKSQGLQQNENLTKYKKLYFITPQEDEKERILKLYNQSKKQIKVLN